MESFIRNFSVFGIRLPAIGLGISREARKTLVIKAGTRGDIVAASLSSLVALVLVVPWSTTIGAAASVTVIIATLMATAIAVLRKDFLTPDSENDLLFIKDRIISKSITVIKRSTIEFIGVGVGEKTPNSGYPHLVYIQHGGQLTVLNRFASGREAVVVAKRVRRFVHG